MGRDSISFKRQLASRLFGLTKWHAWLPAQHSRILMYHRIINPESEPIPQLPGMYVRPETFRMHLEYLTKYFKIIPLEELIKNYSEELTTKEKYIALTFDDAWIDFKTNALPILEEFNVPATVFVPTKFINSGELFWNDIVQLAIKNDKLEVSEDINNFIENLKNNRTKRNSLTKNLTEILASEIKLIPPQFLSWEDISSINNKGLITFGSHSHSHELSTQMTTQELHDDITSSLNKFQEHGVPIIDIFCYPNQSRDHNTDAVLEKLNITHTLGAGDNRYKFKRIGMHEDISCNESLFCLALGL